MSKRRHALWSLILVVFSLAAVGLGTTPAQATGPTQPEVVASGLDNPRGLAWSARGSLLVAEAGRGGSGSCAPGVFTPEPMCFGASGAVTEIRHGTQRRLAVGLPSVAPPAGGPAFGPSDVYVDGGRMYVSVGGPGFPGWRGNELSEPLAAELGTVQQIKHGWRRTVADIAAFTNLNDLDGPPLESNTQSVIAAGRFIVVADAAANTALLVDRHGNVSVKQLFAERGAEGAKYEAVPSGLAFGPDGALYLSDLTGAPFPADGSMVWRWNGASFVAFATGFTTANDLAFGPDGSLYVLENRSIIDLSGRVVRVWPNGDRAVVADGLFFPTGLAVGRDGAVYVSNCGVCAGQGEVLRFTRS
jgi:hypothetical protein